MEGGCPVIRLTFDRPAMVRAAVAAVAFATAATACLRLSVRQRAIAAARREQLSRLESERDALGAYSQDALARARERRKPVLRSLEPIDLRRLAGPRWTLTRVSVRPEWGFEREQWQALCEDFRPADWPEVCAAIGRLASCDQVSVRRLHVAYGIPRQANAADMAITVRKWTQKEAK
jgi:hypothetical protein